MKVFLAILLIGVCSTQVLGDVKCFIEKMAECSQKLGHKSGLRIPLPAVCQKQKQLFQCLEEGARECSVNYDFTDLENLYKTMCTDGTPLNKDMKQYGDCITRTMYDSLSCEQDVIDYARKFKVITPEVLFNITKLACKERDAIMKCFIDVIGVKCGDQAKKFMEEITESGDAVNKAICDDVLKY